MQLKAEMFAVFVIKRINKQKFKIVQETELQTLFYL
jgi:hypothetical protein